MDHILNIGDILDIGGNRNILDTGDSRSIYYMGNRGKRILDSSKDHILEVCMMKLEEQIILDLSGEVRNRRTLKDLVRHLRQCQSF